MKDSSKVLVAIGAGVALGAILGVLFAPAKGSETREKIKTKGKKLAEDAGHAFNESKEALSKLKDEIKEKLQQSKEQMS